MKAIPIDVFATVAGRISLGGAEHDVLHLNGNEWRKLAAGFTSGLEAYAIAARVAPSVDVYSLVAEQIGAIIAVATSAVGEVEAQFPNGDGATATSASPAPPA